MLQIKDATIRMTDDLARVFIKVDGRTMAFDINAKDNVEARFSREYYQVATGRRKTAIVEPAKE